MTQDEATPSVADALRDLEALQQQARERHQARLDELDEEIGRLEGTIENLTAQLQAVQQSRKQVAEEVPGQDGAGYSKIFEALTAQCRRLAARNVAWTEAHRALVQEREAALRQGEHAALIDEIEQFRRDVEPGLESLPASYRKVVVAHHQQQVETLRAHLATLPTVPRVEAPALALELVLAVDADEEGGVAMIVTPVAAEVGTDWQGRDADLQTLLAARVVEGIYTALRGTPLEGLQAVYGPHQDLLALELELPPGHAEGFAERLTAHVDKTLAAEDLKAAGLAPRIVRLAVDLLLPPEDPEADDA
jgi:hypothetical protein